MTPSIVSSTENMKPSLIAATNDRPFINSLGMEFVPVPGTNVLFCRWETRVKDYRAYTKSASAVNEDWKKRSIPRTDDHPVAYVSWHDAQAFCAWLNKKEGRIYRLPTDAEWSIAVGLGDESGTTPEEKSGKAPGYPWGGQYPPPKGAGNYNFDLKTQTTPVGSFSENRFGLFDLSGNLWEWCEDWYNAKREYRVWRGGSWLGKTEVNLRSSYRMYEQPDRRNDVIGFRCVVVLSGDY
jgi:formylglycine-generating enzyme required for sulfatase activity